MTLYAVNLADVVSIRLRDDIDSNMAMILLEPVIREHNTLKVRSDVIDGGAVVLSCDDTRSRAIIAILRDKKIAIRAYQTQSKSNKWLSI